MQKRYTLIYLAVLLLTTKTTFAQIYGNDAFLQGHFLEIGIAKDGVLGSTRNAPTGYHPHATMYSGNFDDSSCNSTIHTRLLAEVYDYGHDGWTTGSPAYMGDYTLPGTPYEMWGVEVGGVNYYANFDMYMTACPGYLGAVTGSMGSYTNSGSSARAVWTGSVASGALAITQQYRLDTEAANLVVTVKFVNTTSGTLTGLHYFRGADPDNDDYWPSGTTSTNNAINYVSSTDYYHRTEVTATSPAPHTFAKIGLGTKDCRAKAMIYESWSGFPMYTAADLTNIYAGTATSIAPTHFTGNDNGDYAIGLIYDLGSLAPYDSTIISFAYLFDGAVGVDEAFPNPQIIVNGSAHDSVDTVTVCAATTLPVSITHANEKDWSWSHWSWSPTTGLASDTGINNVVNASLLTGITTYTITGTDTAMGNCGHKTFLLTIIPIFIPNNVSNNGPLCEGSTLQLTETDTLTGVTTYSWTGPGGFTSTNHNPTIPNVVYADSGIYTVTITNGPCSSPSSTLVVVHATPPLPTAVNPTYCQYLPSVPLTATGTNLLWYASPTGGTGSPTAPTPSTNVPGLFNYYVSQTINGCEGPRLDVIVTVNAKPAPPVLTDVPGSYCPNQPFNTFTIVSGTNILWYAAATGGTGSSSAPSVSTATPGSFTYWASQSVLGCESDRSSVSVTVFQGVTAAFDTAIHHGCVIDTVMFNNLSTNAANYMWDFGDGSSSIIPNPTHTYVAQNTYTVKLYAHSGDNCIDSAIETLPLLHPLAANFTFDSATVCQGHPVSFRDTSIASFPNLYWTFGDGGTSTVKDPAHAYSYTGTYNVLLTVTDQFFCVDTASATISVDSASTISMTITDTVMCMGNNLTVAADFSPVGLTSFVWNFGDGDSVLNVNPLTYAYPVTGSYVITGTAHYRVCPNIAVTRSVNIFAQPNLGLGVDTSICEGSSTLVIGDNINADNPAAHWLWSTGQTTSTISVTGAGAYGLTVNIGGCTATDSITITNDCILALPNIFTPNGDGTNDYFNPRNFLSKGLTDFSMTIYNRWGQVVFKTTTLTGSGWDGMFNDTPQPEGVYIYQVSAMFKDGQAVNKTGNLTLMR